MHYFSKKKYTLPKRLLLSFFCFLFSFSISSPSISISSNRTIFTASASTFHEWSEEEDFQGGAHSNTSDSQFLGDLTLEHQGPIMTDTTREDFLAGHSPADDMTFAVVEAQDDGEVVLNQG